MGKHMSPAERSHRQAHFLRVLRSTGDINIAAEECGIKRSALYNQKRRDPEFSREWQEALDIGTSRFVDLSSDNNSVLLEMSRRGNRHCRYRLRAQHRILEAMSRSGSVKLSSSITGVPRKTIYNYVNTDPEFSLQWQSAMDMAYDRLIDEAVERALVGYDTPIVYHGEITGYYREKSEKMLFFLLKALKPELFYPDHRLRLLELSSKHVIKTDESDYSDGDPVAMMQEFMERKNRNGSSSSGSVIDGSGTDVSV